MSKNIEKMYNDMVWIRRIEEKIASEYSKQEMRCPVHLSIGQEAVPVGVSSCLDSDDHIVSAHRSHAHYLAKGGSLEKMLAELFGKVTGCARGKGGSMHLIDLNVNMTAAVPIVGSSISIGTGIGLGLKQNKSSAKVAVYFGDGATEEGVFSESLDFASLFGLPVLFVCENNFHSVYTHISQRQSHSRSVKKICEGHGVRAFIGDGNDVLAVQKITNKALAYMKKEEKPALLSFETYRWLEHCGPNWDDHLGYRKEGELKKWMDKCPIEKAKNKMKSMGFSEQEFNEIEEIIQLKVEKAFQSARSADFPLAKELNLHVYAD